jgi:hypothetical protein
MKTGTSIAPARAALRGFSIRWCYASLKIRGKWDLSGSKALEQISRTNLPLPSHRSN